MNISTWSDAAIMQLPDYLFGRRWVIPMTFEVDAAERQITISTEALGEKTVVWNVCLLSGTRTGTGNAVFRFGLGDQIPADLAAFNLIEQLWPVGLPGVGLTTGWVVDYQGVINVPMRQCIQTSGRRFVMTTLSVASATISGTVLITVSSMPTEMPSWFHSVMAFDLR